MPDLLIYLVAIIGAFLAGCINTLAGNGSAITLYLLMELLGLPPNHANATNRVGILAQVAAGSWAFGRAGKIRIKGEELLLGCITIGSIGGLYLATIISNEGFRSVFRYLLLILFVVILSKPKRWLVPAERRKEVPLWLSVPVYLALGFYAGFISMGMGVIFLAITVMWMRYDLLMANVLKTLMVIPMAIMGIIWFSSLGWIDWKLGGIMAIGQAAGGYFTAHFASRYSRANELAYYILVVVVGLALIRLWFFA
ncbi:MAG: sulfite exporter TauE/SafE family protein [Bacteroidota bacterium]